MAQYYKRIPTKYPNIYEYETKKGKKYAVRIGYTINGVPDEFDESGIKTLAEARAILREVEDKIDNHEMGLIENKNITLNEYYPIFRDDKITTKTWNKTSTQGYDSNYYKHIAPVFGDVKLNRLDRIQYQRFINQKIETEGFSPESVRSIHNAFMAIINHAVDVGAIKRNRLRRIHISGGEYKADKKHLTLDEYKQFMKIAKEVLTDKMHYCMVYLTTFGMRRGEIMGLTPRYISFRDDGLALIEIKRTRTQEYPDGKGPKTVSSERVILVDEVASDLLQYTINEASEIKKDFGEILHQDDFIFVSQKHGEPYYVGYLNVLMDKVSRSAGIKCTPHMMRHTFATIARIDEANPRLIADFLGHKSTKLTDHYTHKTAEGMEKVVNLRSKRMH